MPFGNEVMTALRDAEKIALTDHVIEWAGAPIADIKKGFARAVARAGLDPDVTPHLLRPSAVVHMAETGVSMEEISQILGHASTKTTVKVYARFSPDHPRTAISKLELT